MSEAGLPLGLIDQQYWSREGALPFEGTESLKWINGLKAANQHLGTMDKSVVLVQDREADIFFFFKAPRADAIEIVVRVHQPRNLEVVNSQQVAQLAGLAQGLPVVGHKQVGVDRQGKPIELTLSLPACGVHVLPDNDRSAPKHKMPTKLGNCPRSGAMDEQGGDVFNADSW